MPSQIPAQRVAITDPRTGLVDTSWYKFLLDVYRLVGSGTNSISLTDLQVGPPPLPSTSSSSDPVAVGFLAGQSGTQTLTAGVWTQLLFATEDYDDGVYDASTSQFLPTVDGDYDIHGGVTLLGTADYGPCALEVRKNGTAIATWVNLPSATTGDLYLGNSMSVRAVAGDYFELWVYVATSAYGTTVVPAMSSDAGSGGYVPFASSTLGGYEKYKAFDAPVSTYFWHAGAGAPQWVGVNLPSAATLIGATLENRYDIAGGSSSYKIQGSNDSTTGSDGTWTDLFVDASAGMWAAGEVRTVAFTTTGSYAWYRWYSVTAYGGTGINLENFALYADYSIPTDPALAATRFGASLIRVAA